MPACFKQVCIVPHISEELQFLQDGCPYTNESGLNSPDMNPSLLRERSISTHAHLSWFNCYLAPRYVGERKTCFTYTFTSDKSVF